MEALEVMEVHLPAYLLKIHSAMIETTFTAFNRQEFENLLFDVAKAAAKAALKEAQPVREESNSPDPGEPTFLTKRQAAQKLGCSTSTIDNAARAGKLTRHYLGKTVRFKLEEVLALAKPAKN